MVWTICLFSVGTAVLGLTQSYGQFAVFRFVSSLGLGALYVACNTLMAEYVPTRYRTTVLGTLQAGWSVDYIVATLLAGMAADRFGRRFVYVFGALGTALFLPVIVLFHAPEHILWMLVVFGFLYGIPYGVNATYMTESFAAQYRGTAVGGAYNIGRIGAAIAPAAIVFGHPVLHRAGLSGNGCGLLHLWCHSRFVY